MTIIPANIPELLNDGALMYASNHPGTSPICPNSGFSNRGASLVGFSKALYNLHRRASMRVVLRTKVAKVIAIGIGDDLNLA